MPAAARRHWSAPEVIQTSAMDCGPAALKSLLEGHGIAASYGRLREACQTAVDGTSIDDLERVACSLGLDVEQVALPVDHLLDPAAAALPALLVVMLPGDLTHFVVAWRRLGAWVQVMDPGAGRRWIRAERLLRDTYRHEMKVEASAWREYASGPEFGSVLGARLRRLGVDPAPLLASAAADPDWRGFAALDAATRLAASLLRAGALHRGREAARALDALAEAGRDPARAGLAIPRRFWSAWADAETPEGMVVLRGAVLLRVRGVAPRPAPGSLPPELQAILGGPPSRPFAALAELARESWPLAAAVAVALVVAALTTAAEALAFRGAVDLAGRMRLPMERGAAAAALLALLAAALAAEVGVVRAIRAMGRRLEAAFRMRLLQKLARLADHYFQSRLLSDMAGRAHAIHVLRGFPVLAGQLLRTAAELLVTAAGIAWLDRPSAPLALTAVAAVVAIPLLAQRRLQEDDLRLRTHAGALMRFHLDALLGVIPVRAHAAERSLRREHESLLVSWARAGRGLQGTVMAVHGAQGAIGLFTALGILAWYFVRNPGGSPAALLLVYWALALPVLGGQLASLLQQLPAHRNTALRLLEILSAPEEEGDARGAAPEPSAREPIGFSMQGLSVRVAGHEVLADVSLDVAPGSHVAVVGASGAGKSTLLGVLLGWYPPSTGALRVDGRALDAGSVRALRARIAWVDPAVHLWNRPLIANLLYGAPDDAARSLDAVVDAAQLRRLLERLPDGMQTALGEGGALVSGGEGQRVRLGRALTRTGAGLVLLDEPFRGLDRTTRRELLRRARETWRGTTLLCVTHDIEHALDFERVIVIDGGRIVEDGDPAVLAQTEGGRLAAMLEGERRIRGGLWAGPHWRRLRVEDGRVSERGGGAA